MKKQICAGVLCALLLCALVPAVPAASDRNTFSDIQGHWAQTEIEAAMDQGWVNGYPDGTFRPDGTITQAEFVKMLLAATHLTPGSTTIDWMRDHAFLWTSNSYMIEYTPTLADTSDHWLTRQGWTDAALYSGLVVPSDYSGRKFYPNQNIKRYEISLMAARSLGLVYAAQQPLTEELAFTDKNDIQDWVKGYVNEAAKAGVITGYPDGSFGAKQTATRAEAVVMAARAVKYMEQGLEPDATVTVQYFVTSSEGGEDYTTKPEDFYVQVIDDVVYIPVQRLFHIRETLGQSIYPTDWSWWNPVTQEYCQGDDYTWQFKAGSKRFVGNAIFFSPEMLYSEDYLLAPPRMLYGELMVPVYTPEGTEGMDIQHNFFFADSWNPDTKELTLELWHDPVRYPS